MMSKVNYSFYLLKFLSKKWVLYFTSLISLFTIIIIYSISTKNVNKEFTLVMEQNQDLKTNIASGLISKPINLILVFISIVPFIVSATWYIFKGKQDNLELMIISRKPTRNSIFIQKIFIMLLIILIGVILPAIAFSIVAKGDNILSSNDKKIWVSSMTIGYMIASFLIFGLTLLLVNFLNFISLFVVVIGLASIPPIITMTSIENGNVVTSEMLSEDEQLKVSYIDRVEKGENIDLRISKDANGNIDSIQYAPDTWTHKPVNYGAKRTLETPKYKSYAEWDSWLAISSIFNLKSSNNTTSSFHGSWTHKVAIDKYIDFNEHNSIEVNGLKYTYIFNNFRGMVFYGKGEYWDTQLDSTGTLLLDKKVTVNRDLNNTALNFKAILNLLQTNDSVAADYKAMPFSFQSAFFIELLDIGGVNMQPLPLYNYLKTKLTEEKAFEWLCYDGFLLAKHFDETNKTRFLPTSMFPDTYKWNAMVRDQKNTGIANTKACKGIIANNYEVNEPHYNEAYHANDSLIAIWITLLTLIIPTSIFIYSRKDFN